MINHNDKSIKLIVVILILLSYVDVIELIKITSILIKFWLILFSFHLQ